MSESEKLAVLVAAIKARAEAKPEHVSGEHSWAAGSISFAAKLMKLIEPEYESPAMKESKAWRKYMESLG